MQIVGCFVMALFAITQLWASFDGARFYTGPILGFVIIALCLFLRFTLPVTIFAFLGALMVWQWSWYWALLFVAPGLILIIPAILAQLIEAAMGMARGR